MNKTEVNTICINFKFYLQTQTQLEPLSVKRSMIAIRRLLSLDVLRDHDTFCHYLLERIDQGFDPATCNKEISAVKHYLTFQNLDWPKLNYFKVTPKNVPAPTLDEIKQILAVTTTPAFDVFWLIQTHCGTRPSEVLNLRLQDVDFNQQCFRPVKTKTNDGKPVIMPPRICDALKEYANAYSKKQYLFTAQNSTKPLTLAAAAKDLRKRLKKINCNMPYTPHSFRHSYITIGIASGVPVQFISRSVRHTKIDTTMGYFDRSVDFAKRAASAHPFYKESQTTKQIIEDCIDYIKKRVDERFDFAKLNEAFAKLYDSVSV